MGLRGFWLVPMLLLGIACGGEEFTRGSPGLDAATSAETGADRTETDSPDADVPPVADGLLLWLRADTGVSQSSGAVSEWADSSGNHLDARQPDPLTQPTLAMVGVSGRPTVVFGGTDFLSLPSGFGDFSSGVSLFAVAVINETADCVDLVHLSNGPEIDDIAFGRHNGRGLYEVLDGVLEGADWPLGRAQLLSVIHDTDRSVSMRIGGGGRSQGTFDLPRSATRLTNMVGRSLYADCGSVHGGIAELLVYGRALTDAERVRVETELQTRWNCCR